MGGAEARITLLGTTVIHASRSAVVAVRLPRPAHISMWHDVDINGRGRFTGVVLHGDGRWLGPYGSAIRFGLCEGRGCAQSPLSYRLELLNAPDSNGYAGTLPAGNYHLYVLADGAPVKVTMRFKDLPGRITLRPTTRARVEIVEPEPTQAVPADAPSLFSGGSTHTVGRAGGLNATIIWKVLPVRTTNAGAVCGYEGAPGADEPTPPYQFPCAVPPFLFGGLDEGTATTPFGPGRFITDIGSVYLQPPGLRGWGGYVNTAGLVQEAHLQQLWLDF